MNAFEPPGETHTLVVPDDAQEMATLFHVIKLEHAVHHYDAVGLGKDHVRRMVR
jgi:2,4'-dihydroxyacetophenone dioxygenase